MKILVFGGHGFMGKNLCASLKKDKHKVFAVSRKDGCDLRKLSDAQMILKKIKPEVIFNLAAHVGSVHYVSKYAADVVYDNAQMALNLYQSVVMILPKVLIINPLSNCSYPGDADIHFEPDWWKGDVHESVYAYGNVKKMIYVLSYCYKKQYGIKTKNFLVPNTYGPGDYTDTDRTHAVNGLIMRMILAKRKKELTFEFWGSGKPIREWGYVGDMVEILKRGINLKEDLTYPVNIAQNKGYSIKEIAQVIKEEIGFTGKLFFNKKYPDGAPVKVLDNRRFRKIFPKFKFTVLKEGLGKTVKYYETVL